MAIESLLQGSASFLPALVNDAESCRKFARKLKEIGDPADADIDVRIRQNDKSEQAISIPLPVLQLLAHILEELARGNGISITPVHAELTTTEAARILKVSRPFLIGLLEKGEIPFRMVGTHRRILYRDLKAYQQKNEEDRIKALEELSALDQEYGLR